MGPKRKLSNIKSIRRTSTDSLMHEIDLSKFCPKKIFDILFIAEDDDVSHIITNELVKVGRAYGDIANLTFITYDEVISLLDTYEKVVLPPRIKLVLVEICNNAHEVLAENPDRIMPSYILAQLLKLKLVDVMYQHYVKEVKRTEKMRKLAQDLVIITKECSTGKKGGKGSVGSKGESSKDKGSSIAGGKKSKDAAEAIIEDYTTIPLGSDNDIIFDDDIFNNVWFYVFQGVSDAQAVYRLVHYNVPVTSIIRVQADFADDESQSSSNCINSKYKIFWDTLYTYFDGPNRSIIFENTMLMNYKSLGDDFDFKRIFSEILYVIKGISDIKLQHLNYIRSHKMYNIKETYSYVPVECLNTYKKVLGNIPPELVNIPILLNSVLLEVCIQLNKSNDLDVLNIDSKTSFQDRESFEKNNCVNPCSIVAFFQNAKKNASQCHGSHQRRFKESFLTYEDDELNIVLNSYKKTGSLVNNLTCNMLHNLVPLFNLSKYGNVEYQEIIHQHSRDPSTKIVEENKHKILHFLYLLLSASFHYQKIPSANIETELVEKLQVHDKLQFWNLSQPKICKESVKKEPVQNFYNPPAMEYVWKEHLSVDVLLQELFRAQNDYTYMEQVYSPETDNLLLQFSDQLDEFGINVKYYDESLSTIVCLRDFCKYISVEKSEWLENNKPPRYIRKDEEFEECKGFKKINQLKMFQEYHFLLNTNGIEKIKDEKNENLKKEDEITFENLLNEIKYYPPNSKLNEEAEKFPDRSEFLSYDFGNSYFYIRGTKTTYHSHDGIKITVDNTRFVYEEPQCTANLSWGSNNLVLHYNKLFLHDDYTFHISLSDGTILSFILKNQKKIKHRDRKSLGFIDSTIVNESNATTIKYENKDDEFVDNMNSTQVLSVDRSHFENLMSKAQDYIDTEIEGEFEKEEQPNIFNSLKQAVLLNHPIYKVNKNLTYLEKLDRTKALPLRSIIKRILHKTIQMKKIESFMKRPSTYRKQDEFNIPNILEFRITLPNGLYITCYPSELKESDIEIKQEFLNTESKTSFVKEEQFRLFSRDGYILVKKIDGTITLLKFSGDIINYDKPEAGLQGFYTPIPKACHCKHVSDYRKKLNKIFYDKNTESTYTSRRAQFRTKRGYVINKDVVKLLHNSAVPFLRRSLLKFDGYRIYLEGGKISQKRVFYTTSEEDYFSEQMYFERTDGFKSIIYKNGTLEVKFADGTKIISTPSVSSELVDGYVFVSLSFEYQHPNYATVVYNLDGSMKVLLSNKVVLKYEGNETIQLKLGDNITTLVNEKNVIFEKTCNKCYGKYNCTFNIHNFCNTTKDFKIDDEFLHAQDSYNKHFYSDFAGNCRRNSDYQDEPYNLFDCNHSEETFYKKLFVVNKNLTGELFWTNSIASTTEESYEADQNSSVKKYENIYRKAIETFHFRREFYNDYPSRFFNNELLEEQFCLQKDKREEMKHPVYATFREIQKIVTFNDVDSIFSCLINFFAGNNINTQLTNKLNELQQEEKKYNKDVSTKRVKTPEPEIPTCKCLQVRIGIPEKISNWKQQFLKYKNLIRNKEIPPYFSSEFCKIGKR